MKRRSFVRNTLFTIGLYALNGKKLFAGLFKDVKKRSGGALLNEVIYKWSGALTPATAKVNAKLTSATTQARLVVSASPTLTDPIYGPYATADASNNFMAAMSVSGLSPGIRYYYAVEADGTIDNSSDDIGSFTTPPSTPFSFRFTVGSCNLNSNHIVYTRIAMKTPLFHLVSGDFHYDNPNSVTDINVHRTPYETGILSHSRINGLLQNTPVAYIWDDHDYSGNDSNALAVGRTNARLAYQEYVPHYPLAAGSGNVPIYQSFTIGRVRFILTDLRSERLGTSMMGATQKAWFKSECLAAKNSNQIIAWVTSVSFGGNQPDNWGGFAAERTELADFFRDNAIQNMMIISGDAHMLAIDNGTNHDFSTGTNNPNHYPVFQAAALNQGGSYKGGTFSEGGAFLNPDSSFGQYGLVDITDNGGQLVTVLLRGYRVTSTGVETNMNSYSFSLNFPAALPIKISSFTVKGSSMTKQVIIEWKVEDEKDCAAYVIERSSNARDFNAITSMNCNGSNSLPASYSFIDHQPLSGISYYRLKAIENDNSFNYSVVRSISLITGLKLKISPNPTANTLHVQIDTDKKSNASYTILNMHSQAVRNKTQILLSRGSNSIDADLRGLSRGHYIFNFHCDEGEINEIFLINK